MFNLADSNHGYTIYSTEIFDFNEFVANTLRDKHRIKKQNQLYSKIVVVKSSGNNFIVLLVFYLIMCFMKAQKNFGKITILKT